MKIEIVPYESNLPLREGWTRLTEKDFNHYESFFAKHSDIKPEIAEEVHVRYVLETQEYPLIIIRHLDWLLKRDGRLIIDACCSTDWYGGAYFSIDVIKSIISRSFDDRLIQIVNKRNGNVFHYEYIKKGNANPSQDTIKKWSFGICTNGSRNERVLAQIEQINSFGIEHSEIIICGPSPSDILPANVRVLDDTSIYRKNEVRWPIGKKKNIIIENATYNNLMILHDRYVFSPNWYQQMCKYGNYFDFLMAPTNIVNDEGKRIIGDWKIAACYSYGHKCDEIVIPYEKYNEKVYINGGYILGKRDKMNRVPMEDAYYWDEIEDVIWCIKITQRNYLLQVDIHNKIYTYADRFGESPDATLSFYKLRKIKEYYQNQVELTAERARLLNIRYNSNYYFNRVMLFVYRCACKFCKTFCPKAKI